MSSRNEKKTKEDGIICPKCGEKLDYVIEWCNTQIGYVRDLVTGETVDTKDSWDSEFEMYACPECSEELSGDICEKISKMLDR